ncbi:MAG: NifU family protein [Bacteroidales bacterium]|nr:NifU family protein [Bacteroidales bacterium]
MENTTNNSTLEQRVKNVIDQIRPYLEADGGNIKLVNITNDNIVNVELQGACAGCPMSMMTLKQGVEAAVKKAIPEIKSVEATNFNM